jgi:hypothetical protein
MHIVFLVAKLMKKLVTKMQKSPKIKRLMWFIAIYCVSIGALAIFHELSSLIIKLLK